MNKFFYLIIVLMTMMLVCCNSSDPELVDREAQEKTEALNRQYAPLMVGTWYYEKIEDKQRYFEQLTFHSDGTLTGERKWQKRELVTIDGIQRYTDWENVDLSGTFSGTWCLKYCSPEGRTETRRSCLLLEARYDDERAYMAYSHVATFDYASETTLRFQGHYVKDEDGWVSFLRGNAEPSF